jgi:hypothetical protein
VCAAVQKPLYQYIIIDFFNSFCILFYHVSVIVNFPAQVRCQHVLQHKHVLLNYNHVQSVTPLTLALFGALYEF